MKKHLPLILGILSVIALIFSSCQEPEFCMDCEGEGIIKKEIVPEGGDSSITIYPVLTPRNYNHCDSFVFYKGTYVEPYRVYKYQLLCTEAQAQDSLLSGNDTTCVCRENPDTKFNDEVLGGINDFLYIKGITNYPYNKLFIKVLDDTSKIRTYIDYNNKSDQFNGQILDTVDVEFVNNRMLTSGIYVYELILYKDEAHQVAFDTIEDKFAIIRSDKDCNNNCLKQAYNKADTKLLK